MAGGTWLSQNKKQPGVYINVESKKNTPVSVGNRGVVTLCKPLSWGPTGTVMEINAGDDYTPFIGYDAMAEESLFLREIFTGTDHTTGAIKVLLYRPETTGASAATAMSGELTITARYNGVKGNDISFMISATGEENKFLVETFVSGVLKDSQAVTLISELVDNEWVVFSGTGELVSTAATMLAGGSDGAVSSATYSDYLNKIEPYLFNIMIYDGEDITIKNAMASFIKRIRENTGRKCQLVTADVKANSEAVISVKNGYVLNDGTALSAQQATWWVGGAQAGANYNESLVYAMHPNAVDVNGRLTSAEIDKVLSEGQIIFMEEYGSVKIVSDINTLTAHTPEKSVDFSYNQVIRVLDTIANDVYKQFSQNFIGKTPNDDIGRGLLKSWIVGYMNEMQANRAVQNFENEDVQIEAGDDAVSVRVALYVQPVTAIEKIYMTITLTD